MGAYQPIQMAARPPILDAMEQVSQSLGQLGDQRERQANVKKDRERQSGQDYQASLLKAQAMWQSGDYEGAAAVMAPYKGRVIQEHQDALAGGGPPQGGPDMQQPGMAPPVSPQGLPPGTPPGAGKIPPPPQMGPPQGGSPLPDGMEFQDVDTSQGLSPEGVAIDPKMVDSLPMPPPQSFAPPPENPLFAAQAATKARDQQKARTLLAFTPPGGGPEQTIDPMAAKDRMRERRIAQLDEAFASATDPVVQKYYPQIRAAAASSDEDIKPMDALRYMHYMSATEQTGINTGQKIEASTTNQGLNRGSRERGQDMTQENSKQMGQDKITAAGKIGNAPTKVDAGNRGDAGSLERAVKDMYAMADGKTLVKSDRALHAAIANVSAGGADAVMAHKDAFMQMERYFRGAVPTEAEQVLLLKHMGGIHGAIEQALADMKTGDFSATTIRNIAFASRLALQEQEKNVQNLLGALTERLGPGSEFELMGSNVNKQVRAQGKIYGYDLPNIYPDAIGGAGQTKLGAGAKPRQAPKAKKGGAKSTADYMKELEKP